MRSLYVSRARKIAAFAHYDVDVDALDIYIYMYINRTCVIVDIHMCVCVPIIDAVVVLIHGGQ